MKDAGIRIRVEKGLREAFVAACQEEERHASDVLREFMQAYVERHQKGQGDLFVGLARKRQYDANLLAGLERESDRDSGGNR